MAGKAAMDFIVVGAGPAGLQMGYFLKKAGYEYVILEAASSAGSFFVDNPRHRTLLSINKPFNYFPEPEFNMRHDWNSLLSDDPDLLFKNYSKDLYPHADALVNYLRDFAEKFKLNILFNTRVSQISKGKEDGAEQFRLETEDGRIFHTRCVLMGTGAVEESVPQIPGVEHADTYGSHSMDAEKYSNKRVLVVGGGNSAFEVANHLAANAGYIHVASASSVKFAWDTHFVGDLRAVNNNLIDLYELKSLHSVFTSTVKEIIKQEDGTLKALCEFPVWHWEVPGKAVIPMVYDHVIACTGWRYVNLDLFASDCKPKICAHKKFPLLSNMWESSVKDLFFIGTAMKSIDRRAASGFIHGFRYNIRTLMSLLEERYFQIPLPTITLQPVLEDIATYIIDRISVADAMYQMNGFLGDVLLFKENDCERPRYLKDFPLKLVMERGDFKKMEHVFTFTFKYSFDDIEEGYKPTEFQSPPDYGTKNCTFFLHPVIEYYSFGELRDLCQLQVSLVVRFNGPPLPQWPTVLNKNVLKNFINKYLIYSSDTFEERSLLEMFHKLVVPFTEDEKSLIELKEPRGELSECKTPKDFNLRSTPVEVLPLNQIE